GPGIDHGPFGVPAAGYQRGEPPAVAGPPDDLATGDQWQLALGQVRVLRLVGVGVVDPGPVDGDQELTGTGYRLGYLGQGQHLGTAELGDLDGTQRITPSGSGPRPARSGGSRVRPGSGTVRRAGRAGRTRPRRYGRWRAPRGRCPRRWTPRAGVRRRRRGYPRKPSTIRVSV